MSEGPPLGPAIADPAVVEACRPLLRHLAYERRVERQEDRVVTMRGLVDEAGSTLRRALRDIGAADAEVQLLDLHGLRARDAREALRTCTEPVSVVWFGKGGGVLRDVFLEFLASRDDLVLVDLGGETRERPQEAMGLVLRRDLHDALSGMLNGKARRRPAKPAVAPPALPAPPPGASHAFAAFWAWLWGLLRRLTGRGR